MNPTGPDDTSSMSVVIVIVLLFRICLHAFYGVYRT